MEVSPQTSATAIEPDRRPEASDPPRVRISGQQGAAQTGSPQTMPTIGVERPVLDPVVGDRTGLACAVCPHPWDSHDRIGVRFCTATAAAGLLDRGCVCIADTNQTRTN